MSSGQPPSVAGIHAASQASATRVASQQGQESNAKAAKKAEKAAEPDPRDNIIFKPLTWQPMSTTVSPDDGPHQAILTIQQQQSGQRKTMKPTVVLEGNIPEPEGNSALWEGVQNTIITSLSILILLIFATRGDTLSPLPLLISMMGGAGLKWLFNPSAPLLKTALSGAFIGLIGYSTAGLGLLIKHVAIHYAKQAWQLISRQHNNS